MGFMPLSKSFKLKSDISTTEVLEILKKENKLPVEPYIHTTMGITNVYIPAAGQNDISIYIKNGKMTVSEMPRPKDAVGNMALGLVSNSFSTFLNMTVNNKEIFNKVVDECERLFV